MTKFVALEFYGDGDPMFGGSADDRPLKADGTFRSSANFYSPTATFTTAGAAVAAAMRAPNRRKGGSISALEQR